MAVEPPGEVLVDSLTATVGFHADHLEDLAPPLPTSSARCPLSGSGRGRVGGLTRSAKRAITSASSVSVLARRPIALAKARIWRGLTTQSGSPAPARAAATVASKPPVASRTTRATGKSLRRPARRSSPFASRGTQKASPGGLRWTSRRSLDTSMPTKTAEGSSMTLPCECGLRPKRLSGFGTAKVGAAPSSVPGLQAQGGRGLTPTFNLAGFVPAGNADIQGGISRASACIGRRHKISFLEQPRYGEAG